jgi:hypothetical protein
LATREIPTGSERRPFPAHRRLQDYAEKAGLQLAVSPNDMLTGRLAHAACYQMGLVIEILVDAIEAALIAESPTLTIDDFADAYASARSNRPTSTHSWRRLGT